jgi:hypothetical protein
MLQSIAQLANRKSPIPDPCLADAGRQAQSAIRSVFFYLLPFAFLLLIACEKNTTPVTSPAPQLTLTVEEVAVTEAWLTLTVEDRTENLHFEILRDDSLIFNGQLTTGDTTLYDASLLPAQTYTYAAQLLKNGHPGAAGRSASVEITTLDTTSHNFQWEMFEFGGVHGSSVFYDVAIVNENDIWAVGEIHTAQTDTFDSLGNWVPPYSAVHWNGQEWELKRFFYLNNSGGQSIIIPVRGIWVFAPDDIWLAAGSIFHWAANVAELSYSRNIGTNETVEKLWANSPSNIYGVGNVGLIVHYDGQTWQRIESGTELPIQDIWGARNEKTGEYEILCVAEDYGTPGGSKVLSIENSVVRELLPKGLLSWSIWGIWFVPARHYIVVGSGIWRSRLAEASWTLDDTLPRLFTTSIHGQGLNDIVVCGAFWLLAHWNGANWQGYFPRTSGSFTAVQIKQDMIIAVGGIENKAVIVSGRR